MMMVLGLYVFMLRTVPYQELQYQRSWRHAANSRVNRTSVHAVSGTGQRHADAFRCSYAGDNRWQAVVAGTGADGRTGESMALIEGSGTIYGMYVIEGLNQTKTEFFRDGMPRRD
ncbi:bacteriophage tail protein GpU [Escherichia coli]|uniref:Bacteriophage tail protein GpU n=1 Tax=Escherichia coli TaxID=562 RepID=A0A377F7A8_ECOLX|nr:bacteriophage tail protein GpU [Escherichia coli]